MCGPLPPVRRPSISATGAYREARDAAGRFAKAMAEAQQRAPQAGTKRTASPTVSMTRHMHADRKRTAMHTKRDSVVCMRCLHAVAMHRA